MYEKYTNDWFEKRKRMRSMFELTKNKNKIRAIVAERLKLLGAEKLFGIFPVRGDFMFKGTPILHESEESLSLCEWLWRSDFL